MVIDKNLIRKIFLLLGLSVCFQPVQAKNSDDAFVFGFIFACVGAVAGAVVTYLVKESNYAQERSVTTLLNKSTALVQSLKNNHKTVFAVFTASPEYVFNFFVDNSVSLEQFKSDCAALDECKAQLERYKSAWSAEALNVELYEELITIHKSTHDVLSYLQQEERFISAQKLLNTYRTLSNYKYLFEWLAQDGHLSSDHFVARYGLSIVQLFGESSRYPLSSAVELFNREYLKFDSMCRLLLEIPHYDNFHKNIYEQCYYYRIAFERAKTLISASAAYAHEYDMRKDNEIKEKNAQANLEWAQQARIAEETKQQRYKQKLEELKRLLNKREDLIKDLGKSIEHVRADLMQQKNLLSDFTREVDSARFSLTKHEYTTFMWYLEKIKKSTHSLKDQLYSSPFNFDDHSSLWKWFVALQIILED